MNTNQISLDTIINDDPTLKFLLREARFDIKLLDHQISLCGSAIKIAISKWIDKNY
jgi:hypothetical protein